MQNIKKVLNSSVVLVVDERGVERVLLGKGIGFGARPGDPVRADRRRPGVRRAATTPTSATSSSCWRRSRRSSSTSRARSSPPARSSGLQLDPHVYLALTDHLHFAVERQRQGLVVVNRWRGRCAPSTRRSTRWACGPSPSPRERLGVELPDEEAANVAFHLVNAEVGQDGRRLACASSS